MRSYRSTNERRNNERCVKMCARVVGERDSVMVNRYMKFLRIPDFVQSGADIYTDIEVPTGCSAQEHLAMEIHAVELFWVPASFVNHSWVEMTLQTEKGQQMGGISNKAVLVHWEAMCRFARLGGGWQFMGPTKQTFDPPILYAGKSLFMALNSHVTGVANIGNARIHYTWKLLTEAEFMEALEQFSHVKRARESK